MPDESILSDDFVRELMNVGDVDIVVGVPTYNDARSVGQVVQAVRAGLLKHFPRERSVIINADGGSRDGTQDLVKAAAISAPLRNSPAMPTVLPIMSSTFLIGFLGEL